MRLFFAVELPSDVQSVLGRLGPKDESRDYRWTDPSLLHVTLAFLGEQPPEKLDVLQQVGAAAASASHTGTLRLGSAGSFGARRAPRVLWVDLTGDLDALLGLQQQVATGLRDAGFALEDRPFRPHITLARRRETAQGGLPVGWPPATITAPTFPLNQLTLMQSRLSPRGATYTPVFEFPIGS